jgi:hypothetical protein
VSSSVAEIYSQIKSEVIHRGYGREITWQSERDFSDSTEADFLRESAWVILSSGFRETVAGRLFPRISESFMYWRCARSIVNNLDDCVKRALRYFRHEGKINAIASAVVRIDEMGYDRVKQSMERDPIGTLTQFSYIGPVTAYHLAKNLGIQVAKPDRHLVRMSSALGYCGVSDMCLDFSQSSGDCIAVVDIVLWRYATIQPNYVRILSERLEYPASCEV